MEDAVGLLVDECASQGVDKLFTGNFYVRKESQEDAKWSTCAWPVQNLEGVRGIVQGITIRG